MRKTYISCNSSQQMFQVYAEEAISEDDDNDDDDDDYDIDYSLEDKTPTRLTHSKKKHLDISEVNHKHNHEKQQQTADLTPGPTGRSKREIQSSGLPVISESYGADFKHNSSEGLRLYESLISSGGKNEPKDTSLDWGSTENPIKNYHRVSPLWTSKSQHKKFVGNPQHSDAPVHRRHRDRSQQSTTGAPSPIISRVSRVMQTDSSDSLLHQPPPAAPQPQRLQHQHKLPNEEVVVRVYQEQRASEGARVSGPGDTVTAAGHTGKPRLRRKKHRLQNKNLAQLEGLDDHPVRSARLIAAAHYDGDTSNYELGHTHYEGNGRLRHPDGKFTDWTATDWMQQLGMNRFFQLQEGTVTVRDSGIYYIYAQIYYVDEHDVNGFRVYKNDRPVLHCTTMTVHSSAEHRRAKSNTCHTSAAVYLAPGDKISVRDVDGMRYSLFEPAKSFFGLIKFGDARIK
ncbi:Ectodysplasin-A [Zootermopsis nevadensis]|uniref:Ectodysplasin-A n=1 Tax=Zootermopsis nevadensis TaxID=136037 RepID=A0A067RNY6_ZOONE|nr:Ectodysplasin-A [Zootermopsis nevadensis]